MRVLSKIFAISMPLFISAFISLSSMIYYYLSKGTLQKKIYLILTSSPKHAVFDIPPFVVISIYVYYLIRKERSSKEIAIRLACMLAPITLFSFYWYAKTFPDPLALGFLPFINMIILIPAWLVGIAITNAFGFTRSK